MALSLALLDDSGRALIAKFSSTTDTRTVVKAEAVAMLLAGRAGIDVAPVEMRTVAGKDVLLVERFDRPASGGRRQMISALAILGLSEHEARYGNYPDLADSIRSGPWHQPGTTLRELYTRLVLNVCVGKHRRSPTQLRRVLDGQTLELTPAYDVAPQIRSTAVATHAIGITRDGGRYSQLSLCRQVAPAFQVSSRHADDIIGHVVTTIRTEWADVCDQALVSSHEAAQLWEREFLNPYVFYDAP